LSSLRTNKRTEEH